MNLRRLNKEGIARFSKFLDEAKIQRTLLPPIGILSDVLTSEEVANIPVEVVEFSNRLEAGKWLHELIDKAKLPAPANDSGLWAWLSLLLFDQLCPADSAGERNVGDTARYIPAISDFRKYYRHLLAGPWRIFRAHRDDPERALVVLAGPVNIPGELSEQIMSRQELITNKTFMAVATLLYVDPKTRERRKGSAGRTNGGARRLADFCNQIDVTWDLYSLDPQALLDKLPAEFKRFQRS